MYNRSHSQASNQRQNIMRNKEIDVSMYSKEELLVMFKNKDPRLYKHDENTPNENGNTKKQVN